MAYTHGDDAWGDGAETGSQVDNLWRPALSRRLARSMYPERAQQHTKIMVCAFPSTGLDWSKTSNPWSLLEKYGLHNRDTARPKKKKKFASLRAWIYETRPPATVMIRSQLEGANRFN
jgi:hypothetical protein